MVAGPDHIAVSGSPVLADGSRVAVVGGGPAGAMFAYFLLDMADRVGLDLDVDIYESRSFDDAGPAGCNMCGGIVSETLVQNLAADGIHLPPTVIQRGIDAYVLHTDIGGVQIATPTDEKRIGAVHRGGGPRDLLSPTWQGFDAHLLGLATARGARLIRDRVDDVTRTDGHPVIHTRAGEVQAYDLLTVAAGVNTPLLKVFEKLGIDYQRPVVTKTLIREYRIGRDAIDRSLGTAMHVFLLGIPRLEFGALIPKGDYVTMVLLGEDIDNALGDAFAAAPEVRACMPPEWDPDVRSCQCLPHINVRGVARPYADRVVFIGDAGVTRLYKDGIGAAYRTAKAAARVAVFEGVSAAAFERHYAPVCHSIAGDNRMGQLAFLLTRLAKRLTPLRRVLLGVTAGEQSRPGDPGRLSRILWDMFTGSAPYGDIFRRMFDPVLVARVAWSFPGALLGLGRAQPLSVAAVQERETNR
jgi:flavin-dependent dehydrogenase